MDKLFALVQPQKPATHPRSVKTDRAKIELKRPVEFEKAVQRRIRM